MFDGLHLCGNFEPVRLNLLSSLIFIQKQHTWLLKKDKQLFFLKVWIELDKTEDLKLRVSELKDSATTTSNFSSVFIKLAQLQLCLSWLMLISC